ncbi:hypothetical protein Pgy4_12936 [Pseudomonas savastanoi pv. glycinea str. race 4]|uniref:Uncharacterized protein n=1 Tax=Pseudomonas savastanoi pv. glycinea str. race 4 TaxID=875330 RepID=F3C4L4_PSESG|nr:hypothetical protein Pgy4_12936 [Pseudomonas savastanoi pv. glycinea str. race 4]
MFARQVLELFKTAALLFEQAILTVMNKVLITWQTGGSSGCKRGSWRDGE